MSHPPFGRTYEGTNLDHIAMPMGGLGAGMICLTGVGGFSNQSWGHSPNLGPMRPTFATLCVTRTGAKNDQNVARVLEGPIADWRIFGHSSGGGGRVVNGNGLPRCSDATFRNRFPFGEITLNDKSLPVTTTITGWSPFVPGDEDASSLPVAGIEYMFETKGDEPVEAVFSFHAENMLLPPEPVGDVESRTFRRVESGIIHSFPGCDKAPHEQGDAFLAFVDEPEARVDGAWFRGRWFDAASILWQTITSGAAPDRDVPDDDMGPPIGTSLYLPIKITPGKPRTIKLILGWYVPFSSLSFSKDQGSAQASTCCDNGDCGTPDVNAFYRPWYASRFGSIDELLTFARSEYASLRRDSAAFADALYSSTLPEAVIDAVSNNLSILKSPTVMRQHDGRFWGWEGSNEHLGCCAGSCTHVYNYEQAIAHIFPRMAQSMRETEFRDSQDDRGHQMFRSNLPIRPGGHPLLAACDGQLGGIIKTFRDWRISGDTQWLKDMWPAVHRSLEYCINTWDPQRKGHITEPHHNTYDIDFWGPDGMHMSFYLCALSAASEMAKSLGEPHEEYDQLRDAGKQFTEQNLFDGEYFYQDVDWSESSFTPQQWANRNDAVVKFQYTPEAKQLFDEEGPKYQYGVGCLSDGVLGEFLGWASGLPPVLGNDKIKSHLQSVYKYNFRETLTDHANPQRPGYAIGDEPGLLLCSWPKGGQLSLPFVYSNEVWTGIEYQVAAHLIAVGELKAGLTVVEAARSRYNGRRRNPFNEYECGNWYARAMSSYALLAAYSGARYDAVEKVLYISPRVDGDFRSFISTATGFGVVGVRDGRAFCDVMHGQIDIRHIEAHL